MSYRIIEVDGVFIDPNTQKFPVEIHPEPHALNGIEHTGVLDDNQIPQNIMRDDEHQNDPHTMIIDGRDVSVDGAKLDTIENGAEANNLTDIQANALTGGAHTNWHHHDDFYYRKPQLQTSGEASVHWDNITNTPSVYPPEVHNHDQIYYTQTQLENGILDTRYYTESEIHSLYYDKLQLDSGQLDNRYYTEIEVDNILTNYYTINQLLTGSIDSRYYTESEIDGFLADKANKIHNHDSVYYTQTQLSPTGIVGSNVLDARYFTEGEITTNYYNKSEVDDLIAAASYGIAGAVDYYNDMPSAPDLGTVYIVRNADGQGNKEGFYLYNENGWNWLAHNVGGIYHNDLLGLNNGDHKHLTANQYTTLTSGNDATTLHNHDSRYYTETEVDGFLSNYYTKSELDSGQLDNRYYTENEIDTRFLNYYTISELDNGQLDSRYFTETEVQANYYSKSELDNGTLDSRYYTEIEIGNLLDNYYDKTDLDPNAINVGDNVLDARYYTESELNIKFNLYFTKNELLNGSIDDRYFTETELLNGSLDTRYYTETEVDGLLAAAAYGITASVDYYSELPNSEDIGSIYIVKYDSIDGNEGFYRWDGTNWIYLAPNTGETYHNNLQGLNDGEYKHLTSSEYSTLTTGSSATSLHIHDDRYYTEVEIDGFLSGKSDTGHIHDNRYYTETEVDSQFTNYYTKIELDSGQLDNRYFTETELNPGANVGDNVLDTRYYTENEIQTNYYNKTQLDDGALDFRYYTQSEVDALATLYYTKTSLNSGVLDDRYYTEIEVNNLLSNYYTKNELETGSLDGRYFTENEITSSYYSKNDLNSGQLDNRYYTETEVDNLIAAVEVFGIKGGVNTYADLPTLSTDGDIYIVRQDTTNHEEGFYKWDGTSWIFLANNTGATSHNDLNGLNSGDYYHLTSSEYNNLTNGSDTTLHNHDNRYYTEIEIDSRFTNYYTKSELDGGQLNTIYYTETEVDTLLSSKSNIGHIHDDRYYTETEVDNKLSNKSDVGHNHDTRYFTQNQIQTNYYSKLQLDSGSLDGRYYTEIEVDALLSNKSNVGHTHDDRYYTETEVDTLLSGKSDTGHIHDDRYYTETEIDSKLAGKSDTSHNHDSRYYTQTQLGSTGAASGADRVGVRAISGLSNTTVQGVLEELNTDLNNMTSNLQEAYESGNTVNTNDANGPVVFNGGTTPPLEVSNQTNSPTQNVNSGAISVINNTLYVYDGGRSKWLTPSKFINFGSHIADGHYLAINGTWFYGSSYKMAQDGTILTLTLSCTNGYSGKDVYVIVNDSIVQTIATGVDGSINSILNIDFNSDDNVAIAVSSSGSPLKGVVANLELSWRA